MLLLALNSYYKCSHSFFDVPMNYNNNMLIMCRMIIFNVIIHVVVLLYVIVCN